MELWSSPRDVGGLGTPGHLRYFICEGVVLPPAYFLGAGDILGPLAAEVAHGLAECYCTTICNSGFIIINLVSDVRQCEGREGAQFK